MRVVSTKADLSEMSIIIGVNGVSVKRPSIHQVMVLFVKRCLAGQEAGVVHLHSGGNRWNRNGCVRCNIKKMFSIIKIIKRKMKETNKYNLE